MINIVYKNIVNLIIQSTVLKVINRYKHCFKKNWTKIKRYYLHNINIFWLFLPSNVPQVMLSALVN